MDLDELRNSDTPETLANALGYSYADLSKLVYGRTRASNYRSFRIPKRRGGFRTISSPRPELKAIQHQILSALTEAYKPTRSAYGFVKRRSIANGAHAHVGRKFVVNVDLADFFPTITFRRVRGLYMSRPFNLSYEVATVLAHICCHRGSLPQGAPTSPPISNFVCSRMDRELAALIGSRAGRYSRYCDDMTMSFASEFVVTNAVAQRVAFVTNLNPDIANVIVKSGFHINQAKLKLRSSRERQEVTGLVVNEKVNVRRSLIRQLHTQLHCVEKFGLEDAAARFFDLQKEKSIGDPGSSFASKIRGRILFVKMIRRDGDPVFAKLARRFNAANIYPKKIAYFQRANADSDLRRAVWVVEVGYDDSVWGYESSQGTCFLLDGVGFVTCAHVVVSDKSNRPFAEIEVFRAGDPRRYRAFVASFDPESDLAILFVEGVNYTRDCDVRFTLSAIDEPVGAVVSMVGFPAYRDGQTPFVSRTEIAATNNSALELGAHVTGGLSGGPLVDEEFRVIGVITRGVPQGGAKNEAVKAKLAFHLSFLRQDLSLLRPIKAPTKNLGVSWTSRFLRLVTVGSRIVRRLFGPI